MKNEALTVQTNVEHTTILQETIMALLECKAADKVAKDQIKENKKRVYLTREKRKQILMRYADHLHQTGTPETEVCTKVYHDLQKFISQSYVALLLPDRYKNPNLLHSPEHQVKRAVKRVSSLVSETELQTLKHHNVVIVPKQKVQLILEASLHCKNNVVLILSKDTRRPIAIYADIKADQYPIKLHELLDTQ